MGQLRCIAAVTLNLYALETSSTRITDGIEAVELGRGINPGSSTTRPRFDDKPSLSKRLRRNLAGAASRSHSSHNSNRHNTDAGPETDPRTETMNMVGHESHLHLEPTTTEARLDDAHDDEHSYSTMHVSGFRSSWRALSQSKERVSYLGLMRVRGFSSLLVAVLLSFGLSFGLEYVASRRQNNASRQGSLQRRMNQQQRGALASHHATMSFLAHVAMLVAMTYSLELMVALVAGHMTGYYLCHSPAGGHPSLPQQTLTPAPGVDADRRRRRSPQAHRVVAHLQGLWRNRFQRNDASFQFLSFPAARERIRRQAFPERRGRRDKDVAIQQQDDDAESSDVDESTRDEDEVPLLRKRDTKK